MTRPHERRLGSAGDLRYLVALGLTHAAIARRIGRTENAVRDEIYREDQREKEHRQMMQDYTKTKLAEFMKARTGKTIDITGTYGGQSPDLAAAWMDTLTNREHFPTVNAQNLAGERFDGFRWYDAKGGDLPEPGDLVVWSGDPGSEGAPGYGHAGIFVSADEDLFIFTQSPGPCSLRWLSTRGLLGWHRYEGTGQ